MPDVFDEIAGSPSAPTGDVFDQVAGQAAEQFLNTDHGPLSAQEQQAMAFQRAHPATPAAPAPQPMGAVQNAFTAAFHAVGDPLGNAGVRALGATGLISPEREQAALGNQIFQPEGGRLSAKVGAGLGQAAQVAFGPAAPLAFATELGEQEKEQIEARQAAGQQIAPGAQVADVLGQAGLGYALGAAAPGGRLLKPVLGRLPGVVSRIAAGAGVGAAEQAGQQVGGNLIRKGTVAPEQKVGEGVGEAAITGAAFGAGGQGLHEGANFLSRLRSAQEAGRQLPAGQEHEAAQSAQQVPEKGLTHVQDNRPIPPVAEGQPAPASHVAPVPEPRPEAVPEHAAGNKEGLEPVRGGATPAAEPAEHPARISGGQALADYVAKISPDSATAPLIGTMTEPHGEFVRARVPIDQLHTGEVSQDLVAAKTEGPQKNPAVTIPGEAGLDVIDGNHSVEAARARGDTHAEAYVPESMVGKNGIEAISAPAESPRQMFGARSGKLAMPEAATKLMERNVAPSVLKTARNLKQSANAIHRFIGSGVDRSAKEEISALNVRENLAKQDLDRIRTESALKPYREIMEKWTPDARRQWIDAVEAGRPVPDPKTFGAASLFRQLNEQNIKEGEKYGLDTSKWNTEYIGRLAEFPAEQGSGTGSRSTIAGAQKFLKKRVYNTFSEFKKAVEEEGGKLKYENPMDMALAKQNEIRQSIEARRLMYHEEDRGMLKWVPDGEKPPEEHGVKLNDRLAVQERPEIAPKQLIARLAKMQHFDAQKFMEGPEWQKKARILRPGETMPEGFNYTGQDVRGTLHGTEGVANVFNSMVNPGITKDVPVLQQMVQAKRAAVAANLALSAVHASLESVGNAMNQVHLALDNIFHGELGLAWRNLKRANPATAYRFGRDVREQVQTPGVHPELEDVVTTSLHGGNRFDIKSVLNKDSFAKAKDDFAAGDKITGTARVAKGLFNKLTGHDALFEKMIPNFRAAAKAAAAETAIKRGYTGEKLQRFMGQHQDNIDNIMGSVIRTHQFQNKVLTDLQDLIFTAPKFVEGTARHAMATVRDTVRVFKDMAAGQTPTMTPAMYTAMAGAMTHMIGAAAIQAIYTKITTGKMQLPTQLHDYFAPRTGRKDDQGRDERISLLTPFSALFSLEQHGATAITGRIASGVKAAANVISGVDERGVQIRNPDEGAGKQALDTAKYIGKELLPYSIQNLMEQSRPGASKTADARIGSFIGARFYHESDSAAERLADDISRGHAKQAPRTREEADRSDLIRRLADQERDRGAGDEIEKAIDEGKLTGQDAKTIRKEAHEQRGLGPMLKRGSFTPAETMRIWTKMTPQEKEANEDVVRRKLAGSKVLSKANRQKFMDQIDSDLAVGAK